MWRKWVMKVVYLAAEHRTLMVATSLWAHPGATEEYGSSQVGMDGMLILKSTINTRSGTWSHLLY